MYLALLFVALAASSVTAYNYDYMQEDCGSPEAPVNINLSAENFPYGYIRLVRNPGYSAFLDCTTYLWAPANNYYFVIRFRKIDINKPESACTDVLYMSGNTSVHEFCGSYTPSYPYVSSGNMIKFHFLSYDQSNDRIGYDLYYTAFHHGSCDSSEEFQCRKNDRCIPRELTCDGRDNCGDWSDERTSVCGLPAGSVVMITLICLLVGGTCFGACLYYWCEMKKPIPRGRGRQPQTSTARQDDDYSMSDPDVTTLAPPPYSATLPPYTEHGNESKAQPPPAYDNFACDTQEENAVENRNVSAVEEQEPSKHITVNVQEGDQHVSLDSPENTREVQQESQS